jgi:nitric oxide reductase NorD protein
VTADDGVTFHDIQRVLGLFADAVAGQPMHLEPVADDRRGWPWDAAHVPDGETVRLPAAIADFDSAPENRHAFRAAVLHQAGYAEFGTLDLDPDDRDASFAASHHPGLLRQLFTILEDVRVGAAIRRRYPGARHDLDLVATQARHGRPHERPVRQRDDLVESLRLFSIGVGRSFLLADSLSPGRAALLARILDHAEPLRTEEATPHDAVRIAAAIGELVDEELPLDPEASFAVIEAPDDAKGRAEPPGDDPRRGDVPRPPSADMEQGDEAPRLGGQIVEMLAPDPGEPEPERPSGRRPTDLVYPPPDDERGTRVFRYDEWSYLDRRYLRAWCRVLEKRLHGDDTAFIGDVRRRHAVLASRVRRQFAFVRPEGWVRVHHAEDGDELDIDAVIEAVVDRRTGHIPDDDVHIRRERSARDVATAFLVDLSASTSSPVVDEDGVPDPTEQEVIEYRFGGFDPYDMPPPPEPSRRVLDVAKESVALMCDALEVLGDRHAVYGFSGEGRDHVDFHVAKDFDDRTSPATWSSIAAMKSLRYTRMGPAVRHASAKLAAQPSRTKLLIVISDGYPQDTDYGPVRGDNEYGLEDTAHALREALDAGIHPYCVTIDPAGHDYLRRMCPDQSYVVIDDVPSLPRELAKLYRSLAL